MEAFPPALLSVDRAVTEEGLWRFPLHSGESLKVRLEDPTAPMIPIATHWPGVPPETIGGAAELGMAIGEGTAEARSGAICLSCCSWSSLADSPTGQLTPLLVPEPIGEGTGGGLSHQMRASFRSSEQRLAKSVQRLIAGCAQSSAVVSWRVSPMGSDLKNAVATAANRGGCWRCSAESELLSPGAHVLEPGVGLLVAVAVIGLENVGDGEHRVERGRP